MKRKTILRHWKRETLEQVLIQGQQLDELQQTVVNLQSSIKKSIEQQQEQNQRTEKSIRDIFEISRNWQENKIDNSFIANQQWLEALLKDSNENQRKWEEEKIDSAFTANQQWQEALTKAQGDNQRKWEEEKIDSSFIANQQWQEAMTKAQGDNQRKWEEEKIDSAFTANQQWQEKLFSGLIKWVSDTTNGDLYQALQNLDTLFSAIHNLSCKVYTQKDQESYEYYRMIRQLTTIYSIEPIKLVRIGKDYDGGYIMADSLSSAKIAYSIGISDDTSWDHEMAKKGYQVYQYDHTIEELPETNPSFHWIKKGLSDKNDGKLFLTLPEMLFQNEHSDKQGMVLKIDIEGSEWDVIDSLPETILDQFDQILIEFHNINEPKKRQKILSVLRKLNSSHAVIHVHGNNYGRVVYCDDLIMPDLLEITYVNRKRYKLSKKKESSIPSPIDFPNRKEAIDIWIPSWNLQES